MKKLTKIMISIGSIASVLTLPLVAAACNNTDNPKPNPNPNNPNPAPNPMPQPMPEPNPKLTEEQIKNKLNAATFTYNKSITDAKEFSIQNIAISDKEFMILSDMTKSNFIVKNEKEAQVELKVSIENKEYTIYVKFTIDTTNKATGAIIQKDEFDKTKAELDKIKNVQFEFKNKITKLENYNFNFKDLIISNLQGFSIDTDDFTYFFTDTHLNARITIKNDSNIKSTHYVIFKLEENKPKSSNIELSLFEKGMKLTLDIQKRETLGLINSILASNSIKDMYRQKLNALKETDKVYKLRGEIINLRVKFGILSTIEGLEKRSPSKYNEFKNFIETKWKSDKDSGQIFAYLASELSRVKKLDLTKKFEKMLDFEHIKSFKMLYEIEDKINEELKMMNMMKMNK
ncbi:variable surface lipoprotein [Mycoplasma phocoeninasale]|uniref:Variable surface lipoprotein n=1 Tax=Mycoplasma phocoeninasale TaxID=2726117 RepID=A0A858U3H7_9MOLU|nr:variable surface lipoprotein [Mycoplasma phocoeninasale]QJG66541.1 variable surface lipoprotein [Mycoplasma phocoeninasale]